MQKKMEPLMMEMEQWSILSNVLNYAHHGRFHTMRHILDIKAVNKYKYKPDTEEDKELTELDFGSTPFKLHEEYMDIHEGIQSEIISAMRFNENSNLSTAYLERVDKVRKDKLRAEESFPISEHGYTSGKLLDETNVNYCQTQVQASHLCQNHSTCNVSHSTHCQNLHQRLKEYMYRMVNVSVSYLSYQ